LFYKEDATDSNLKKLLSIPVGYNNAENPWLKSLNKKDDLTDELKWVEMGHY
jgi:hypothetical protein